MKNYKQKLKNVYARLLKSNEQITCLVQMVMRSINMETIKADLEEHKKLVSEIKNKNNDNNEIKTKKNKQKIAEFIESIELF